MPNAQRLKTDLKNKQESYTPEKIKYSIPPL
jgi:hypothetical protein